MLTETNMEGVNPKTAALRYKKLKEQHALIVDAMSNPDDEKRRRAQETVCAEAELSINELRYLLKVDESLIPKKQLPAIRRKVVEYHNKKIAKLKG